MLWNRQFSSLASSYNKAYALKWALSLMLEVSGVQYSQIIYTDLSKISDPDVFIFNLIYAPSLLQGITEFLIYCCQAVSKSTGYSIPCTCNIK